jgi:hypothetical protein
MLLLFVGGSALQSAENGSVVAIFVGTLVKLFEGKYLVFSVWGKTVFGLG